MSLPARCQLGLCWRRSFSLSFASPCVEVPPSSQLCLLQQDRRNLRLSPQEPLTRLTNGDTAAKDSSRAQVYFEKITVTLAVFQRRSMHSSLFSAFLKICGGIITSVTWLYLVFLWEELQPEGEDPLLLPLSRSHSARLSPNSTTSQVSRKLIRVLSNSWKFVRELLNTTDKTQQQLRLII